MSRLMLFLFGCLLITLIGASMPEAFASNSKSLEILRAARRFDEEQTGEAGDKSPTFLAYEDMLHSGVKNKAALQKLVENASPAGRVYAAILLLRLDKNIGEEEIKKLAQDKSRVQYMAGCMGRFLTVKDLVNHINSTERGRLINFN